MRPSSVLTRSNPLVQRLRRHGAMATLYRSIDEEMALDDGRIAYQSPVQPGKPAVMSSLVLNRDAHVAEPSPASAEIRPAAPRLSRSDISPPVVQRQPIRPATPPSSSPSSLAEKATTQEPIPAEKPTTAESESADFDWIGENEWTSLKTFMEGHQKKLAGEKGKTKEDAVQRTAEDSGRSEAQEKTRAELARRQELARRGQLPRAQVQYISGDEQPGTGLSQTQSPAATEPVQRLNEEPELSSAEPVQRLPEEPEFSSAEPDAESGIEQSNVSVDDATSIPAQSSTVVQRTQAETSPPSPESKSLPDAGVQDTAITQEPAITPEAPIQDGLEPAATEPAVLPEPGLPEPEQAPDVQRTAEVAPGSVNTGDRPLPESTGAAPAPESKPGTGLGNRIFAAAKSLFRGDKDPKEPNSLESNSTESASSESSFSEPDIASEETVSEETPDIPDQEVIHRAPDEGDTIVGDALKPLSADREPSIEPVDDVESPNIPADDLVIVGSSDVVVDLKKDLSPETGGVTLTEPLTAADRAEPAEIVPLADETQDKIPGMQGDRPFMDLPRMGPATVTGPDISRKPIKVADTTPEARPATVERQETLEPTRGPEMAEPAGSDAPIFSEPTRPASFGDEVDTIVQEPQGPVPEAQPPMLQRKQIAETAPGPEMADPAESVETSISDPTRPIPTGDVEDTVIQKSESTGESLSAQEVRQESPHVPSEPEYQPGLEPDLSEPPAQILSLDAVWPVERLEPPTIIPPPVKMGDAIQPGPAVQRKPAGDDPVISKVHGALKDVAPAQPTDSAIELVTPRRPRPSPPVQPQKPAADVQREAAQIKAPAAGDSTPTADQKPAGEKESPYLVSTEVGDLPSDFWEYLGEKPPPPSSEKSSSQGIVGALSPPDLQRAAEPLVTQEFPLAGVQREEAPMRGRGARSGGDEDSGEIEETSSDGQELDISELARQVFPEIKRRLNVDWERGRGQF